MSAMGNLVFEVQEFVDPRLYTGQSNQKILEEFDQMFTDHPNYLYMKQVVENQLKSRQYLTE
jgi:hypothetical protein